MLHRLYNTLVSFESRGWVVAPSIGWHVSGREPVHSAAPASVVVRALHANQLQLEEGALVTVDPNWHRIRLLPI